MRDLLRKYIKDGNENGLYLLPFPTGFGKSYEVVQYIAKEYKDLEDNKHIFFLTSNLNNLPIKDLKNALGEDDYEKNVIVVKSYLDYVINNFDLNFIPKQFHCKITNDLDNAIRSYNDAYNMFGDEKHKNFKIKNLNYVQEQKNKLVDCEVSFRKYIYNIVSKKKKKELLSEKKPSAQDQIFYDTVYDALKNDSTYKWIGNIYPNIFVKEYKIILMSVKKFLTYNSPFYESKYSFIGGDISENALVFIDEFDSTKAVINDTLIEQSLHNVNDYMLLVETICNKIMNYDDSISIMVKTVLNKHKKSFALLCEEAKKVFHDFKVYKPYYCDDINGRNFLFNDFTYRSIFNTGENKYAYVLESKEQGKMRIHLCDRKGTLVEQDGISGPYNLYTVLRSLNHLLLTFRTFIISISKDYKDLVNDGKQQTDDLLSSEQAISSLYSIFGLRDSEISFMVGNTGIQLGKSNKKSKMIHKKNSYYDRGFKTFEFTNKASKNETTSFGIVEIRESAESVIAKLANKSKVIGISATARINSVLCNYSLSYFKNTLEGGFHDIEKDDIDFIRKKYREQNKKYKSIHNPNGSITPIVKYVDRELEFENKNLKFSIHKIFKDEKFANKAQKLLRKYCMNNDNYFLQFRYLSIAYIFKEFLLDKDMKSFLCLTNKLPSTDNEFNEKLLNELFELIIKENGVVINENYFVVLRSGNDFEDRKDDILNRLHQGEKVFLMSAYATLGAGQNLPYYPSNDDINLINLNDKPNQKDPRNKKKDFDGIYLGEITNIITNLYSDRDEFSSIELYNHITESENLYENEEMSYEELTKSIKNGFKKLISPNEKIQNVMIGKMFKSKVGYITKQTIQAVGRLNRTFNKRSHVHLYLSSTVFDFFDVSITEKEVVSPEIEAISEYISSERGKLVYDDTNYQAEHVSHTSKYYIYQTLSGEWTKEKIDLWKDLREIALKYPTISEKKYRSDRTFRDYYIKSQEKINSYYFYEYGDFSSIKVFFEKRKNEAQLLLDKVSSEDSDRYLKECSVENARLSEILKYPGLKEYFKSKNYATNFKENDYIFSPVIYQNIYKGSLGEVAGKFILEKELNVSLQDLDESCFEKFDYKLTDNVYIDFKHWRMSSVDKETYLSHVYDKLKEIKGKKVYVINIIDENESNDKMTFTHDYQVVEVPFLLNSDTYMANQEVIKLLQEELMNE